MITFSRLGYFGQLGNQMLQYAMLQGVATKRGYEVRIPQRYRGYAKKRGLVELEPFQLSCAAFSEEHAGQIRHVFRERYFHFDATVFDVEDGTDFRGYFFSHRYFNHCADLIRREFTLKEPHFSVAARYFESLRSQVAPRPIVSLAVRRGDRIHWTAGLGYYARAQQWLAPLDPVYLVCADDIPWCRENFDAPDMYFLDPVLPHYIRLVIESLCDHHIMAISSFSWWAAWLNPQPGKIVTLPEPWHSPAAGCNPQDMCPAEWIRLPKD